MQTKQDEAIRQTMSDRRYLTKDQELARKVQRAFREQERAQLAERGIAAEEKTDRHRGRVNDIHAERAALASRFADSELISRMCRAPDHQARHHSGRG